MARQKKTTARRGRPPKNAAAPKRKYTRRKISAELQTPDGAEVFAPTQAQRDEGFRHQALYMALEVRKLTPAVPHIEPMSIDVDTLIGDAEKIRKYLSNGIPEGAEPVQKPETDPDVVQVGSSVLSTENDPPYTIALRDAAE